LLGDAAHAIPPTGGQGACMALEDSFTLGLLLAKLSARVGLPDALDWWQTSRQARVAKALTLTQQLGELRLPQAEREKLARERGGQHEDLVRDAGKDLHWLYSANLEEAVSIWLRSQSSAATPV
jgi:2-polyprenyl-6-methoxyphenol hydroxylase-like FAD-dependent oxidoreductase